MAARASLEFYWILRGPALSDVFGKGRARRDLAD